MSQLESLTSHSISMVEIINLQMLPKLYFIRHELYILNQVMLPVEDKIRELMELVQDSMRHVGWMEQIYEKE